VTPPKLEPHKIARIERAGGPREADERLSAAAQREGFGITP